MIRRLIFIATAATVVLGPARADDFPNRPITMVVGYPVGGATDLVARIFADGMRKALGQSVVVENVSGAAGSIGAGRVARAAPDGYTINFGDSNTHVTNAAVYKLSYDVLKDFEPVALLPSNPMLILGRKDLPAGTLGELTTWLKQNARTAGIQSSGPGSPPHIAAAYFQERIGLPFQIVPYRGSAPAMVDLVAGRLDLSITQAAFGWPYVREGQIKAFAVTAPSRWLTAPAIPTVDEAGLPGFHMSVWRGLWAPRNTPTEIIEKLHSAVAETLADPAVRQRLDEMGEEIPRRHDPEALRLTQQLEADKWWPIVKAMNIQRDTP